MNFDTLKQMVTIIEGKSTSWTVTELSKAILIAKTNLKEMFNNPHTVVINENEVIFECMEGSTVGAALKKPMSPFTKTTYFDNKYRNVGTHYYYFTLNRKLSKNEVIECQKLIK
jgi:hypothetical protein